MKTEPRLSVALETNSWPSRGTLLSSAAFILRCIYARGPSTGLEIVEWVAKHTNGEVEVFRGAVYPQLWRLARAGYLGVEVQKEPTRGGRIKKVYSLTLQGVSEAIKDARIIRALYQF